MEEGSGFSFIFSIMNSWIRKMPSTLGPDIKQTLSVVPVYEIWILNLIQ